MERRLAMDGGGFLRVREDGLCLHFEAEREADDRGIYKVWILGGNEGKLLLGTLVPERGRLYLRKTLAQKELEQRHVWPVTGGEVVLAFPFAERGAWYCEQNPGRLVRDPVLRHQLKGPMLCKRGGKGFRLAALFRTDRPVMLNTLLCLASVEQLEGKSHFIWSFDREGNPISPTGRGRQEC